MKSRAQSGFTLIELVLAVALLAAMLAMAWGGLSFTLRAWDTGESSVHRASDLRLAENFLRRELTEIFPMRWKDPGLLKFAFEGEAKRLRFVSARPPGIVAPGLALVSLDLESKAGERSSDLVMRRAPPDDEAKDFGPLDKAEANVLIAAVERVEFAYFGSDNDVNPPRWNDAWTYPTRMPLLIRVRIHTTDGKALPDIVARLALGEEAGCLENTFQRVCRPRRPT